MTDMLSNLPSDLIYSRILPFLDAKSLLVVENSCKGLRDLTGRAWEELEASGSVATPLQASVDGGTPKNRILRFLVARDFCCKNMGDGSAAKKKRCRRQGWDGASQSLFESVHKNMPDYEFFVRISTSSGTEVVWEGFVPADHGPSELGAGEDLIELDLIKIYRKGALRWPSLAGFLSSMNQRIHVNPQLVFGPVSLCVAALKRNHGLPSWSLAAPQLFLCTNTQSRFTVENRLPRGHQNGIVPGWVVSCKDGSNRFELCGVLLHHCGTAETTDVRDNDNVAMQE
jgi:hypothetical protein